MAEEAAEQQFLYMYSFARVDECLEYCQRTIKDLLKSELRHGNTRYFAVFDVDDTLIDTHGLNGFAPIEVICAFRDAIRQLGVFIHYLTARNNVIAMNTRTINELSKTGAVDSDSLMLMPFLSEHVTLSYLAKYKTNIRQQIINGTGLRPLINVGNSWSDVVDPTCTPDLNEMLSKQQSDICYVIHNHQNFQHQTLLGA